MNKRYRYQDARNNDVKKYGIYCYCRTLKCENLVLANAQRLQYNHKAALTMDHHPTLNLKF